VPGTHKAVNRTPSAPVTFDVGDERMIPENIIAELRGLNEEVPRPLRLPTDDEIDQVEQQLGISFHPDFRQYLRTVSGVVFSLFEPVTITCPESHTHLPSVADSAWSAWCVPKSLVPICENNADLYCVGEDGKVIFWAHDTQSPTGAEWSSVGDWIKQVWIEEGKDLQQ
jgi:hypothetical protein